MFGGIEVEGYLRKASAEELKDYQRYYLAFEECEKYYEKILKETVVDFDIKKYFQILAGKNQLKKMVKEIFLFHFPGIAYLKFKR